MIMARAVIITGRRRVAPGLERCFEGVLAFCEMLIGKRDDQHTIGSCDADAHDGSHQRGHTESGSGEKQDPADARQGAGECSNDDECFGPGLKIDHQQQVDQRDGKDESGEKSHE